MTATTSDRNTNQRAGHERAFPAAAGVVIPSGAIACLNASGVLVNGTASATLKCVGVPKRRIDNTGGADGAVKGETSRGVFGPFANSAAGDQITLADVGADCFIVDNQTVAKTNGGSTRSVAGKVYDVDANGVYVNFTQ